MKRIQLGFTIIELAVVIVVIAVLAAISIVVYRGIQERAGTVAYAKAAEDIETHLTLADLTGNLQRDEDTLEDSATAFATALAHIIMGGAMGMPIATGYCVGYATDYPAVNGFAEGECYRVIATANGETERQSVSIDTELTDKLARSGVEIPGKLPTATRRISLNGADMDIASRGIYVIALHDTTLIMWSPPDPTSCGTGTNARRVVLDAARDKGGIDGLMAEIKADPARVADMQEQYGTDWEATARQLYEVILDPHAPGACMIGYTNHEKLY